MKNGKREQENKKTIDLGEVLRRLKGYKGVNTAIIYPDGTTNRKKKSKT